MVVLTDYISIWFLFFFFIFCYHFRDTVRSHINFIVFHFVKRTMVHATGILFPSIIYNLTNSLVHSLTPNPAHQVNKLSTTNTSAGKNNARWKSTPVTEKVGKSRSTLNPSYVQEPNLRTHVCSSNGKYSTSISHEDLQIAGGFHSTSP